MGIFVYSRPIDTIFLKTDNQPKNPDGKCAYGTTQKMKCEKNDRKREHKSTGKNTRNQRWLIFTPQGWKKSDKRSPLDYHNTDILPDHVSTSISVIPLPTQQP